MQGKVSHTTCIIFIHFYQWLNPIRTQTKRKTHFAVLTMHSKLTFIFHSNKFLGEFLNLEKKHQQFPSLQFHFIIIWFVFWSLFRLHWMTKEMKRKISLVRNENGKLFTLLIIFLPFHWSFCSRFHGKFCRNCWWAVMIFDGDFIWKQFEYYKLKDGCQDRHLKIKMVLT